MRAHTIAFPFALTIGVSAATLPAAAEPLRPALERHDGLYLSAVAIGTAGGGPSTAYRTAPGYAGGGLELALGYAVVPRVAIVFDAAYAYLSTLTRPGPGMVGRLMALVDWRAYGPFDFRLGMGVEALGLSHHDLSNIGGSAANAPNWDELGGVGPVALVGGGVLLGPLTLGLDLTGASVAGYTPIAATTRVGVTTF